MEVYKPQHLHPMEMVTGNGGNGNGNGNGGNGNGNGNGGGNGNGNGGGNGNGNGGGGNAGGGNFLSTSGGTITGDLAITGELTTGIDGIVFQDGSVQTTAIDLMGGEDASFDNVGIGVMNPAYRLEVNGDARITGPLRIGTNTLVLDSDPILGVENNIYADNGNVVLQNRNITNGNVGIGAATPTAKLHIQSAGSLSPSMLIETAGQDNACIHFKSGTDVNDLIFQDQNGAGMGLMRFGKDASGGTLSFQNRLGGVQDFRFTIVGNGNTGIGNLFPKALLHVGDNVGTVDFNGGVAFSDKEIAVASNTANQTVSHNLAVMEGSRNSRAKFFLTDATAGNGEWGLWQSWGAGGEQPFVIGWGNDDAKVKVTRVGNVGIGVQNPERKLHLANQSGGVGIRLSQLGQQEQNAELSFGNKYARLISHGGIKLFLDANNDGDPTNTFAICKGAGSFTGSEEQLLSLNHNGNLGLGINNPTAKLHVPGSAFFGAEDDFSFGLDVEMAIATEKPVGLCVSNFNAGVNDIAYKTFVNADAIAFGVFPSILGGQSFTVYGNGDIHSQGLLGIGTTDPEREIHIHNATAGSGIKLSTGDHPTEQNFELAYGNRFARMISDGGIKLFIDANDDDNPDNTFEICRGTDFLSPSREQLFKINQEGNVGIGTNCPQAKLAVNGKILVREEIKVEDLPGQWCDYVFDESYDLMPLDKLGNYIRTNKHLPNIPAAEKVENEGLELVDMQIRMMEKIEELTLYLLDQNETMSQQKELLVKQQEQMLKQQQQMWEQEVRIKELEGNAKK